MQREFNQKSWERWYQVVVSLASTNRGRLMTVSMTGRNGAMGFSRRMNLGAVSDDVATLFAASPGWVLADALEELGIDSGMADVIRNAD